MSIGTGSGMFNGLVEMQGIQALNQPEAMSIGHAPLSILDHDDRPVPMLAEQIPSLSDGSWVVNADGTMQVTWRLRRNVKWHDGAPFTARDVRFSLELVQEGSLPTVRRLTHHNISSIDVVDDHTLVMHWRISNPYAHVMTNSDLYIYPEHIVRPLWATGEGERILGHDWFHGGFVGLGPYRVERWNPDNSIVFAAFDDYFLGRPKIDQIVFHQFDGSQALLTQLLAGQVRMTNAYGLNFVDGQFIQNHWAATGDGTVHWTPVSLQRLALPPDNPLFRDVRVRRALLIAIDRDEINHTLFNNAVVVAHSLLHPNDAGYTAADPVITKYRFDPREALALMQAAGWQRGSDGVLANEAGDRFEISYRAPSGHLEYLNVQGAIGDFWKEIGVRTTFETMPRNLYTDNQEVAKYLGVSVLGGSTTVAALYRRWHSTFIPTAENRFLGDNLPRWNNAQADRLLERLESTFEEREKEARLVELAKLFTNELPCLPLYYQAEPIAVHKSLKNARPRPNSSGQHSTTWDCYQWELT